jgi:hypothetical protein
LCLSKLIQALPGQHKGVLGRILRPAMVTQQAERAPVRHVLKAPHQFGKRVRPRAGMWRQTSSVNQVC